MNIKTKGGCKIGKTTFTKYAWSKLQLRLSILPVSKKGCVKGEKFGNNEYIHIKKEVSLPLFNVSDIGNGDMTIQALL
jgi:hypothetical protein